MVSLEGSVLNTIQTKLYGRSGPHGGGPELDISADQ
jgi:hypothetical protein